MHTPRLLLTTLTLVPALASAATKTWDGQGALERWASGINWVGNNAPNSNDDLVWPTNGALGYETDNDYNPGTLFRSLTCSNGTGGADNGWVHDGNRIALGAGGITLTGAGGTKTTFRLPLTLWTDQTWNVSEFTEGRFEAAVDLAGRNLTLTDAGDYAFHGAVNGTGSLTVLGDVTVSLLASNDLRGRVTVEDTGEERLLVRHRLALGQAGFTSGAANTIVRGVLEISLPTTGSFEERLPESLVLEGGQLTFSDASGTAHNRMAVDGGVTFQGGQLNTVRMDIDDPAGRAAFYGTLSGPDEVDVIDSHPPSGRRPLSLGSAGNTCTGDWRLDGAWLQLACSGGDALRGDLHVNEDSLAEWMVASQLGTDSSLFLARNGVADLDGKQETVVSLNMAGGELRTAGPGANNGLYLKSSLSASVVTTGPDAPYAPEINGKLVLDAVNVHTFDVQAPAGMEDTTALVLNGDITQAGGIAGEVHKTGSGCMAWTGTGSIPLLVVQQGMVDYLGASANTDIRLEGGEFRGAGGMRDVITAAAGGSLVLPEFAQFNARNVSLNGATRFAGVRPGIVNHPVLIVSGTLNLGGAEFSPSFPSGIEANALQGVIGEETVLIQKTSAGAVQGTFTDGTGAPLAEGALISIPARTWRLSYAGGDGNDVTLTLVSVAASGLTHGYTPPDGATNQWTNHVVWNPAGPVFPGAALTFGPGTANVIPFNNFAAGTCMDSLKFTAAGYNVGGNALALRADIETTYSTGTTIVHTPLLLTGTNHSFRARTNAVLQIGELTSGSVDLNGKVLAVFPEHPGAVVRVGDGGSATPMITGAGTVRKTGAGTAIFGRASTYTGLTTVEAGTLRIEQQGAALGANGAGNDTEIYSGAVLELANLGGSPVTDKIKLTGGLRCDAGGGNASITGELLLNGAARSVDVASGMLVLGGAITGISGGITKSGPGTLYISGTTHTFSGPFVSNAGSVRLVSNANRWPGYMQILGGSLSLESNENLTGELLMGPGTSLNVTSGPQSLAALHLNTTTVTTGTSQISAPFMTAYGNGLTTWTGPLHVRNGSSLLRVNDTPAAAEDFLVNGALTGAAGAELRVEGTGTVKFAGNNTLPTITLCEAVSVFTGSSPGMTVKLCGGNMAGTGTVGPITAFAGGGRIDPGLSAGILNSGSIAWNAETTFAAEIASGTPGTNYDQLSVTGTVNLGGAALLVIPSGTPSGTFTIINNDGTDAVTGTFAGLPESAIVSNLGKSFRISYAGGSGNDVTLTAIVTGTGVTRVWDGGDVLNTNWNDPDNWLGDIAPAIGDDLVFPAVAADKTNTNNFAAGTTFNSIRIEGSGYTLNGNALSLNAGLTWDYASGLSTVNLPVTLVQPQTFSVLQGAQGSITGLGAVNNGGLALTTDVAATGQLTMLGISGTGGLTKNGAGRLTLGANSYSGATVLNAGLTSIGGVNAFGTATSAVVVNTAATLQFDSVTGTFTRPVTLNGKLAFLNTGMTASGGITLNGTARQIEVTGVTPSLTGIISGSGGLQKTGSGTLTLGGGVANTFTGGATVTEGTLRLAKSINQVALPGPVTIGDGTGTDILLYATANQIGNAATVNLLGSGAQMQCSSFTDTIGALRFTGGTVTGSGTLTVTERLESFAAATTATVDVNFVPLVSPFSIAVEDGAAATDLAMASDWLGAATLDADRTGPGTFAFRSGTMRTLTLHEGTTLVTGLFTPADILLAGGTLGGDGITTAVSTESGKKGGISPGASPGQFTLNAWTGDENTTLTMEIGGLTPGTQHDQLIVSGVADPRNATLTLVPLAGYTPQPGQSITLIQNDGPDRNTSEFSLLPEGARFDFAGARAEISYSGGDGNEVTLTILSINSTGTTRIWDGEGGNLVWSNPLNWNDDIAPVAGDSLVFPIIAGQTQLVTVNDLPIGTNFHRISLTGRNNVITGNAVLLNAGIQAASTGANFVALGITQTGPQTIEQSGNGTLTLMTAGTISLGGHALTFSMPGNSKIIAEGVISGSGGVIITGASAAGTTRGSVLLTAANTYSGACTMISGVLRVISPGSLGNSVSLTDNSQLVLESSSTATFTQPVTLRGEVISANAPKQWNGVVTLPAGFEGVLTSRFGAEFTVAGRVQGTGGLVVLAEDPVKLAGTLANTFTGGVRVFSGDLVLQKPAGVAALSSSATILGAGTRLLLAAANQIADTATVTLEEAEFNLAGFSDTIAGVALTGGTVATGAGTLTLTGGITSHSSEFTSAITGNIAHTSAGVHLWDIGSGSAGPDFQCDAIVAAGSGVIVRKTGAGDATFTGACVMSDFQLAAGTVTWNGTAPGTFITLDGGTLAGTGTFNQLTSTAAGGTVTPGTSPGILHGNNINWNAATTFRVEINGPAAGTQHDQLHITGTANPQGAVLDLVFPPGFTPLPGQTYMLLDNQGPGAVLSEFSGFSEGQMFEIAGATASLTYSGGDGNDVVISVLYFNDTGIERVWDGGGPDANWMTPENWVDDLPPVAGDSLLFPSGAAQLTNNNDFPAGTNFHRITVGAPATLNGNSIFLNAGLHRGPGPGFGMVCNIPIGLTGPQTFSNSGSGMLIIGPTTSVNNNGWALTTDTIFGNSINFGPLLGTGSLTAVGDGRTQLEVVPAMTGAITIKDSADLLLNAASLGAVSSLAIEGTWAELLILGATPRTVTQPISLHGRIQTSVGNHALTGIITVPPGAIGKLFPFSGTLAVNNCIEGAGAVNKGGDGTLKLQGTLANTFSGGFQLNSGPVLLGKPAGVTALPGPLTNDPVFPDKMKGTIIWAAPHQVADTVTIRHAAHLDLSGFDDTVDSVTLRGGSISTGAGTLTLTGGMICETGPFGAAPFPLNITGQIAFSGPGVHLMDIADSPASADVQCDAVITVPAGGILRKTGPGSATFTAASAMSDFQIAAGLVTWDSTAPATFITLDGGTLAGTGTFNQLTSAAGGGTVTPGTSPGVLHTNNIHWNAATTFRVEINGPAAGTQYDQIAIEDESSLGGATLDVQLNFAPAIGDTFTIIPSGGTGVLDTFAGLPEGAHFFRSGTLFRINYAGGTGGDTVLTVVEPIAPEITTSSIAPGTGPNAGFQVIALAGTGIPGAPYVLEHSPDLITWTPLQTTTASPSGAWSFNDSTLPVTTARTFVRVRLE